MSLLSIRGGWDIREDFFGSEISVAITERKSSNSKFLSRCNKIILFELYRTSQDFGEPGKMFAKVSKYLCENWFCLEKSIEILF